MDNTSSTTWMNDEKLISKAKSGYFVRSADMERVYCPGGVLYKQSETHTEHGDDYRYFNKEQCATCPHKNECYIKKGGKYKNYRVIYFGKAMEKKIDFELDTSKPDFEQIEQKAKELWNKHFEKAINLPLKSDNSFGTQCQRYRYIIEKTKKQSSVKLENSLIHTKLTPFFKGKKLNQITKEDIIAWLKSILTLRKIDGKEYPTKYFSAWIYTLIAILKLDYEKELDKIAQAKKKDAAEEITNNESDHTKEQPENNATINSDGTIKFTCNTNDLKHALKFVSKSLPKDKNSLKGILVKVIDDKNVSLVVKNEKQCETLINISAEVSKAGEVMLAAYEFIRQVNKVSSENITIEVGTSDQGLLSQDSVFIAAKISGSDNNPECDLVPIIIQGCRKHKETETNTITSDKPEHKAVFKEIYNSLNDLGKYMIKEIIMSFKKCEA